MDRHRHRPINTQKDKNKNIKKCKDPNIVGTQGLWDNNILKHKNIKTKTHEGMKKKSKRNGQSKHKETKKEFFPKQTQRLKDLDIEAQKDMIVTQNDRDFETQNQQLFKET